MTTETTTIKITGRNFAKAVSAARKAGGRFDPATKTWAIPSHRNELNGAGLYGWTIVDSIDPATTYVGQASMDAEHSIF